MSEAEQVPAGVDPTRPSPGRVYDYLLGGTENFEVDRRTAEQLLTVEPEMRDAVWANRGFLQRAARWLAAEAGVEQFLDLGAGLPTRNNTHEAAQQANPDVRVAYVDNDPMVIAHGKRLLEDVPHTVYVGGEFENPDGILRSPEVRDLIDFTRPVGVLLIALLHFVPDREDPYGLVRRYLDAVPSGSYLAISHATSDMLAPDKVDQGSQIYSAVSDRLTLRSKAEVARFFEDMEIVPPYEGAAPDVTWVSLWGAEDAELADSDGGRIGYCAVARKT